MTIDVLVVLAWSDWGGPLDGSLMSVVQDVVSDHLIFPLRESSSVASRSRVVSSAEVNGFSTHRAIKCVVQAVRDVAVSTDGSSSPSTDVVMVVLSQLGDMEFRRSLVTALKRCRGEGGDARHDAQPQLSGNVMIAELCVGVGRTCDPSSRDALVLMPWLEGAEAALAASLTTPPQDGVPPRPSPTVGAVSLPTYYGSTQSAASCDVLVYVRNLWMDGYQHSLLRVHPELQSLRWVIPVPEPGKVSSDRWECLFLGVSETLVALSQSSSHTVRLGLSPQARRIIVDWCCYENRCVCFVQCGSCASGERYPLGLVTAALLREFSVSGSSSHTASPTALEVPMASYFTYLFLDDVQEMHHSSSSNSTTAADLSATGAHLSAAPLPLTLSGLSAFVTSRNVELAKSKLVASEHFCKTTEWLSVLPKGFCIALPPQTPSGVSLSTIPKPLSLSPLRVPHVHSIRPCAPHSFCSIPQSVCVMPFGHRRRGELFDRLYWANATSSLSSTSIGGSNASPHPSYACSLEHFRTVCDSDTAKIARQYVQGNYLQSTSIRMLRVGDRSVFATAQCASSDQKSIYAVEVGTIQGCVVHSYCTCPAFGKQLVCRHGAALCVCLLGVVILELEDSLLVQETVPLDDQGQSAILCDDTEVHEAHQRTVETIPFTYIPTAVQVTSSGLPAYLMASAKAEEAKSARGKRAASSSANTATPRVNPLYLQGISAPKGRRTTPFFYYSGTMRAAIREEHPEWSMTDVSKHLGLLWKQMPQKDKDVIVQRCKDDGDRLDALWEEYRTTEEYRLLLEASETVQAAAETTAASSKRRRTERGGGSAEHAVEGDQHDNEVDDEEVPLERFHAMNPEWRCDENGQWVNDWDAREEGASRSTVSLVAPHKMPKLGSIAKLMPRAGGFASRAMSEAETKASLYRSALAFDDEEE